MLREADVNAQFKVAKGDFVHVTTVEWRNNPGELQKGFVMQNDPIDNR